MSKLTRKELWEIGPITDAHYEKRKKLLQAQLEEVEKELASAQRKSERLHQRLAELEHKWELEVWYRGLSPEEKAM